MITNGLFHERNKVIVALSNTTPSTSTPRKVNLKHHDKLTIVISVKNATTVTGSAIALVQSKTLAGTPKALAFSKAWRNLDVADAPDALDEFAVSNNTFTTDSTNSKELLYVIEVSASDLDASNDYDVVGVTTGNATAATLTVTYILSGAKVSPQTDVVVD